MSPSRVVRLCVTFVLTLALVSSLSATTFTVTTTADSGAGSLRQAVISANGAPGPHTIAFNIVGGGPHSIALATDLPMISVAAGLTIDGTTQPGFAGTPVIEVHRDGGASTCFQMLSTPMTIKALAINRCGSSAINSNGAGGGGLTLLGSRLGTDPSGTVAFPNGAGVLLSSGTNTIGGSTAGDRNIISNNNNFAIQAGGTTSIQGNYIGVDATGSVAMLNTSGINCGGTLLIGGSASGQGNVISGSSTHAIQACAGTTLIQGNRIGTNASGTAALPNVTGIEANNANGLVVGGTGAGAGNVIGGSTGSGLRLTSSSNVTVQGNFFGTNAAGTADVGNFIGIEVNTVGALIGTATPGGPGSNLIAFNHRGIVVNGQDTTIRGNSIRDNTLLGIDLADNGVSRNDAGDVDGQQNFPHITSAVPEGGGVRIIGVLDSTASSTFDLDFYESPGCSFYPQDLLEGPDWLGTAPVTTNGSGHAAFNVLLTPVTVAPDLRVSATATTAAGRTSEFSQQIVLSSIPLTGNTGGSPLQIQGMEFVDGATVTLGGVPATNVQVVAATFITAQAPALPAGSINDLVVTNPSGLSGTLPKAYVSLFADVDPGSSFRTYIGGLVANGLTVGCGGPNYCPFNPVTRQQMAVFLLRGKFGLCYTPPPCTGTVFDDVACAGNGFRPVDRSARRTEHHGRLRREQLLPHRGGQPAADGGLSSEVAGGLGLPAAAVHEPRVRRRSVLEPLRSLDQRARRAPDHGRLRRRQLLPDRQRDPAADGGVPGQDVFDSVLETKGRG